MSEIAPDAMVDTTDWKQLPTKWQTAQRIKEAVAREFKVPVYEIMSRRHRAAFPRQVAIWITRRATRCSFPEVGQAFDREYTTCIHAWQVVEKRIAADPEMRERIIGIVRQLGILPDPVSGYL